MIKSLSLTATNLRLILSVSLFLVTILAAIGFYFVNQSLRDVAVDVSHSVIDANASDNNLQTLQKIQRDLTTTKEIVERADSIVADSQSYQYQNQIITDLNDYAKRANITITNMDFATTAQGGAAKTPTTSAPAPATTPPPAGVKSSSVSVTLKNPINYTNLLRFIKSIEQNLTKMQISRVTLSKDSAGGISSEAFTIEVYVR